MTEEEIDYAMRMSVDFNYILKRVLDIYEVNYYDVDLDSYLLFRKMNYIFTEIPPETEH